MESAGAERVYPEEYRERYRAALCIASLKHVKLSTETAMVLRELKTRFTAQIKARRRRKRKARKKISNNPTEERVNAQSLPGSSKSCMPSGSYFPPDIPPVPRLNGLVGRCSKPFEKQLTKTDVNLRECRLSIHKSDFKNAVKPLLKEEDDTSEGIPVTVYDANGEEYPMTFIHWSDKIYVLKEGWTHFCNDHGLLAHQDFVTLWVFRNLQTGGLCFVITSRRLEVFEAIKRPRLN